MSSLLVRGQIRILLILFIASGQVFRGIWNKTPVALKVLATEAGVTPSSAVRHRFSMFIQIFMSLSVGNSSGNQSKNTPLVA